MIFTPVPRSDTWVCLIRRGMLFSETEAVEYIRLSKAETLTFSMDAGVDELLLVLKGRIVYDGNLYDTGTLLLVPENQEGALKAVDQTTLLSVCGHTERVTSQLPRRIPEIPISQRVL